MARRQPAHKRVRCIDGTESQPPAGRQLANGNQRDIRRVAFPAHVAIHALDAV